MSENENINRRFVRAIAIADVPPGGMAGVTVEGHELLVAQLDGRFHAIQRRCPHMGADLSAGRLVGSTLICPKHAAAFDMIDGSSVNPAKLLFLKMKTRPAKAYSLRVENGWVLIGIDA